MAEINMSKKAENGSKKAELPKTTIPKPEATKPEASKPEASNAEASNAGNTKIEKSESKSDVSPKSTSQASISHFSSVSTPEYRSGWNAIFGGGQEKEKLEANQDTLPTTIEISDENVAVDLRQALDQHLGDLLKHQGYDLPESETSVYFEYKISCGINRK